MLTYKEVVSGIRSRSRDRSVTHGRRGRSTKYNKYLPFQRDGSGHHIHILIEDIGISWSSLRRPGAKNEINHWPSTIKTKHETVTRPAPRATSHRVRFLLAAALQTRPRGRGIALSSSQMLMGSASVLISGPSFYLELLPLEG